MNKRTIVGYGLGQYYESLRVRGLFKGKIEFDYYCDRKWEDSQIEMYDGIPIISMEEIKKLENPLVVILIKNNWSADAVICEFEKHGIECKRIHEIIPLEYTITGIELKEKYGNGYYHDEMNNTIHFDMTVPDKLYVIFGGMNNQISIGRNVVTASLVIRFGNEGVCRIGDNSDLVGTEIYVSYGNVEVGENCLLSNQIIIRNHDGHHIFDKDSGKRINNCTNIKIGNHVWIGQRAMLLGGASMGTGSVVGAGSIVTKSFGDHVVVAGVPAKIIRENICWSSENTDYFNRDCFGECVDQIAREFF